jgi:hypothetical protein
MLTLNPPKPGTAYHQVWYAMGGQPARGRLTLARYPNGRFQTIRETWSIQDGKNMHVLDRLGGPSVILEWPEAAFLWNHELLHLQVWRDRLHQGEILQYHPDLLGMAVEHDGKDWTTRFPTDSSWSAAVSMVDKNTTEQQWKEYLKTSDQPWPAWRRSQMPRLKMDAFEF